MTRLISIISAKGGVGKTTLTANIGACLAEMGHNVVILDANITTPNLGLHLGIPLFPVTLNDVLKGSAKIHDAIYEHESGLKIVPSGISLRDLRGTDARDLPSALLDLLGSTDIVIIDAAAGLGREALAAMGASDEVIIVTNPELTAVTDALKAVKLAQQLGTRIRGVVVNRVSGKKHQMTSNEIMSMLDDINIIAEIPEDIAVQEAIAKKTPVVLHKPGNRASEEIRRLSASIVGREYRPRRRLFSLFR